MPDSQQPSMSPEPGQGLPDTVAKFIADYEKQLSLPNDFVVRLLVEPDDWSFILKLHGVLEDAVSKKLLQLLGKPSLAKPFRRVPMRTLIGFAEKLEAISKRSVTFLEGLGELRNRLVHDVSNVGFVLDQWATDTASAAVKSKLLGADAERAFAIAPPFNPYRFALWGYALAVLAELQVATLVQAQGFLDFIDAEVKRWGPLQAEATREALLQLMSESEASDAE